MKDVPSLESKLDRLGDALRARPSKAGDIMDAVRGSAAGRNPAGPARRSASWRTLGVARWAAGMALAASLIVAVLWWWASDAGTGIAFAEVQEAVRRMKTAVITMIHPLQPELNHTVYLLDANQSRKEQNALVFIHDRTKEQMLVLNPADKTAWFTPAPRLGDPWASLDRILKVEEKAVEKLGQREFDGKTLVGFRLGPFDPKGPAGANAGRCEAWIDPQTRLPVRLQCEPADPRDPITGHERLVVEFAFNTPLDSSLFSMTPPKDYRLVEHGPLGPSPKAPESLALASPVIAPGVGIGQARFGMPLQQVTERLGPPSEVWYVYKRPKGEHLSRTQEGDDYVGFDVRYKPRGFTLFVDRREGLTKILSHDGLPVFQGFKAFSGRTSEGVSLGSTQEQVEKAYGPPEKVRKLDKNLSALGYDSKGLWFLVTDGKVTSIEAKGPSRQVSTPPATPAPKR